MPLYNNLIRKINEEAPKDEDKKHYQFWEGVDKSPIGQANRWLNQPIPEIPKEQKQLYRSGEKGKVLQGIQYLSDTLGVADAVTGFVPRALGWTFNTAMDGLSDATGYDKRTLNTGLTILGLSKAKVIPRNSRLYRTIKSSGSQAGARAGTQARYLKKNLQDIKTQYEQRFSSDPSKRIVNVNAQAIDSVFNMPPAEFQKIVRLARQEGINSLTLARRFNQQQGTIKTYLDSKGRTDLTEGAKDLKGALEINWNNYGYTPGTEPTQVRNVKDNPQLKTQVADSLNAFYQKTQGIVQSRTGSRATSSQIKQALQNQPQYWTNPDTEKIYRAAWKGGLSNRYTLKPINRQYLEKQQSTAVQKQIQTQYQKGLQKKNIDLKQAHDDKYDILYEELSSVQEKIKPYDKGQAVKGLNYDNLVKRQNELNVEINNLEQGRWYTEHNVYLQSEKARNYILDNSGVRINDSKEFQLGNVANQTPRLENIKNPDTIIFRNLKNKLERVLDNAPDNYFSYPNYIVNSNPRLSGGREGIIRIEYSPMEWQSVPGTDRMRPVLTDFKVKGGILSGKSVIEIDTKDIAFIKRELNTPEDIQNWLSREHGINPVSQDQSFPKESFEIRLSKSPLVSRAEQIKEFQRLVKEVQAGRKTWAEVFNEAGYEIVPQTGKGSRKLTAKQLATKLRKQAQRAAKKQQTQAKIQANTQKKQGQIDATERLTGPPEYRKIIDEAKSRYE